MFIFYNIEIFNDNTIQHARVATTTTLSGNECRHSSPVIGVVDKYISIRKFRDIFRFFAFQVRKKTPPHPN